MVLINFSFAQAETIKVAADPWCPFTCSAKSERPGFLIEVLKLAFAPEFEIEYIEMSWDRALNEVRTGKFGAIAGALKEDTPDFLFPTVNTGTQLSCFLYLSVQGLSIHHRFPCGG